MITNVFVSVIVCMVIMIIGNNLARAFALVGALSIIRFRTVVKDTKDLLYFYCHLASGMATGIGSYFLALAGNVIISLIAFIMFKTNYGSIIKSEFILQFRIKTEDEKISNEYNKIIAKFTKFKLYYPQNHQMIKRPKVSLDIIMKEDFNQNDLI